MTPVLQSATVCVQAASLRNLMIASMGLDAFSGAAKRVKGLLLEENALSVPQAARNCLRLLERRKTPLLPGETVCVVCMDYQLARVREVFDECYTGRVVSYQTASSDGLPVPLREQLHSREERLRKAGGADNTSGPDSPELAPASGTRIEGFDAFGEPIPYQGNLILAQFGTGSQVLPVLERVQSILRESSVAERFWFPPVNSLHVPLFEMVRDGSRTKAAVYPRHSWKEIHEDVWSRTTSIRQRPAPYPQRSQPAHSDCAPLQRPVGHLSASGRLPPPGPPHYPFGPYPLDAACPQRFPERRL